MAERHGITVRLSTAGTPAPGYAHLGGGYRWRKVPGWTPGDVRFAEPGDRRRANPGAEAHATAREKRLAEFTAHRAEGLDVADAGKRLGLALKTAKAYERARLAVIREARDA